MFLSIRQYISDLSHQPSRGHKIQPVSSSITGAVDLGLPSVGEYQSNAHPRSDKYGGRFLVTPQTSVGGVETQPRGNGEDMAAVWQSGSGPLCLGSIDPVPPLDFTSRKIQSSGSGCSSPRLARSVTVCLSPYTIDLGNCSQSPSGKPQATASSAKLARETLVSSDVQALRRGALEPSQEEGSPPPVGRSDLAPESRTPTALCLASEGPEPLLRVCDQDVQNTIMNSRAPSTRSAYAYRWKFFSDWCREQRVSPEVCPVPLVLRFLQSLLDENRAASTLRVYVAAISAHHVRMDGQPLGSHALVTQFLRGAQRLRPPQSIRVPSWDLSLVLKSLTLPPFEPLEHSDLKWLSLKTAFLLAITSAKRVSELHALSVNTTCMRWNADDSVVTLWPNPAFLPKRLSALFRNQAIELAVFNPPRLDTQGGSECRLLCPVRALRGYLRATKDFRQSDQLFLCFGGPKRGQPLSKQRLSHWVVEAITHAYVTWVTQATSENKMKEEIKTNNICN